MCALVTGVQTCALPIYLDELLATLLVGDQTALELHLDLGGLCLVAGQDLGLVARRGDVVNRDRDTGTGGPVEASVLERVERGSNLDLGVALSQVVHDPTELLLADRKSTRLNSSH